MKEYIPQILSADTLLEKAKSLPKKPGVYLFFDKKGEIIYVGKSRALHDRVLSYFQNRGKHPPKTEKLVQSAADFQTIVTATEQEALILENEKIKLHKPKFNIRLKDDKNYPYIRLSAGEPYPRLSFARSREKGDGKSLYFGPFSSSGAVRSNIDLANKLFSLPTCKKKFPQEIGKTRPCLFYHLGRCIGVCTGKVDEEEYARRVEEVTLFFKQDHKKILSHLQKEMEEAAEAMEFEKAAVLRDRIGALKTLSDAKQVVKDLHFYADVFGVYHDEVGGCIHLLAIREGRLVDSTPFHFGADEILSAESFAAFVLSLYRGRDEVPRTILVPDGLFSPDLAAVAEVLPGSHDFHVPQRGEGKRLLEMAENNAKEAAMHRRAMMARDEEVLVKLASLLGLEVVPERIESIDISNSGASQVYAGIITVENARFLKRAYKSFSIATDHPDDTGCMYEAVTRRGKRYLDGDENFAPLPDLFLVDGAAGQVNAVKRAFSDLGLFVPVFGMVKDAFHKTRCLTDGEHDISIAHDTRLFQFIYSIQEEVHRFSLSRMDTGRRKTVKRSSLTEIRGIGEKKATALIKAMKSIKAIRAASVEELSSVPGISQRDAEEVYKAYHTKEKKD